MDIVNKLRMCTEELHSVGGFNGYASAMSLAADEIAIAFVGYILGASSKNNCKQSYFDCFKNPRRL